MWKSGKEQGRPGTIHHVSDVRWTRGGCRGVGPVVVSAGPEAVHHRGSKVETPSQSTQLGWSVCLWLPPTPLHSCDG